MSTESAEVVVALPDADVQLLYFTTQSLDRHDRCLWCIVERAGVPDVCLVNLDSGAQRRLTTNPGGRLWQYQGFGGARNRGLGVWSVALDDARGVLYHIQDDHLRAVDADGAVRELARLRPGVTTGFIDVSDDGRWLCVPTTEARALCAPTTDGAPHGGMDAIDCRCQDEGLNSWLDIYDTADGSLVQHLVVPRCWITHVQFRPGCPEHILYNHEWPSRVGMRRMWLWDGDRHRCLRPAVDGVGADDWICHEVWTDDGAGVLYHGGRADHGPALVGRCHADGTERIEIELPPRWRRYGHFQPLPGRDDVLVSDGYYEEDDDPGDHGRWISLLELDYATLTQRWRPLCRHGSTWRTQDDHPHPIVDHAGRQVYFTGNVDGRRAVCRVAIAEL